MDPNPKSLFDLWKKMRENKIKGKKMKIKKKKYKMRLLFTCLVEKIKIKKEM